MVIYQYWFQRKEDPEGDNDQEEDHQLNLTEDLALLDSGMKIILMQIFSAVVFQTKIISLILTTNQIKNNLSISSRDHILQLKR